MQRYSDERILRMGRPSVAGSSGITTPAGRRSSDATEADIIVRRVAAGILEVT